MLARTLLVLGAVGCAADERTYSTDLAHYDVGELTLYMGSFTAWGDLRPANTDADRLCPVLGTDFHARVGKLPLSTFPGGASEYCNAPENMNPCVDEPTLVCDAPFLDWSWPPPVPNAQLVIADRSRAITCELGDAFATRTMKRVDAGGWVVRAGERITLQMSMPDDLTDLSLETYFAPADQPLLFVPHVIDADTVTFTVPRLPAGEQKLYVRSYGDTNPACDVPARAYHEYSIGQTITVQL